MVCILNSISPNSILSSLDPALHRGLGRETDSSSLRMMEGCFPVNIRETPSLLEPPFPLPEDFDGNDNKESHLAKRG